MTRDFETSTVPSNLDVEQAVAQRYSSASQSVEPSLCCPVTYDGKYLAVLPQELIDRDYGCGDPSQYLSEGETVVDLGSGGGKICYIASQVVGPEGRVIGIDMNDDMLDLARRYQQEIGDRIGYHNVTFHKGRIQDLALDLDRFEDRLRQNPVQNVADWLQAQSEADQLRRSEPMIASDSADVIVSNCVLNLVATDARQQLFAEMFRVLRRGGRAVISDIVCDEPVPQRMRENPTLWSGCISGAYVESEFLDAFTRRRFLRRRTGRSAVRTVGHRRRHRVPQRDGTCLQGQTRSLHRSSAGRDLQRPVEERRGRRRPYTPPRCADGGLRQNFPHL